MSDIDPLTITHEDITNRLKIYGIIPDILASAPPYFAKITFGPRLCPSMGQQVELHQVKYPPIKLEWPALEDDFFTLLLVDIDAPSKMAPYEREYLHWMAVNIQGPDLKTDEIVVDYISPHPLVGTGNHRFVFFVLRQPDGEIEFREGYLNALHHDDSRRTSFSSRFFAKHYEMEFYAVNFLRIEWSSPDSQYRPWHHKKINDCDQTKPSASFLILNFIRASGTKSTNIPEHAYFFSQHFGVLWVMGLIMS